MPYERKAHWMNEEPTPEKDTKSPSKLSDDAAPRKPKKPRRQRPKSCAPRYKARASRARAAWALCQLRRTEARKISWQVCFAGSRSQIDSSPLTICWHFDFSSFHHNCMLLRPHMWAISIAVNLSELCAEEQDLGKIKVPKEQGYQWTDRAVCRADWLSPRR